MAEYPLPAFHFQVKWNGDDTDVGFSEVSGLTMETQLIEYREGSSPEYSTIKMPGIPKYSNIVLKRGIVHKDNGFFEWLNKTKMNKAERRDLIISLLNEENSPVVTWKAVRAFPVKVEGPSLKSTGNEVAVESMEVAHEGLFLVHS